MGADSSIETRTSMVSTSERRILRTDGSLHYGTGKQKVMYALDQDQGVSVDDTPTWYARRPMVCFKIYPVFLWRLC